VREDPFEQLERSHRRLEERLDDLAMATSGETVDLDAVREVAAFFARAVRRHEDDEERSLFPRLRGRPELVPILERLSREHREHEALHTKLDALAQIPVTEASARPAAELRAEVEAVGDALTRAYRAHIEEEERHLFPAARAALDATAQAEMVAEMQARRGR
jgi:hemerythrin-like domain-containing protein